MSDEKKKVEEVPLVARLHLKMNQAIAQRNHRLAEVARLRQELRTQLAESYKFDGTIRSLQEMIAEERQREEKKDA